MPTGSRNYPEFYGTACPKCGEPLKIYPMLPLPKATGSKSKDQYLGLDWRDWRAHMKKEHE